MEIFLILGGIFWNIFGIFWNIFGISLGIFLEVFFGEDFLGGIFGGRNFLVEFLCLHCLSYLNMKGIDFLSRFCVNAEGRKENFNL